MSTLGNIWSRTKSLVTGSNSAVVPVQQARYMRGNIHPAFQGWRPQPREPRREIADAYKDGAGRAIDLMQNLGWIAGAVDQAIANTVGTGLRLDATPDPKALGMTPARAKRWAQEVEKRWQVWARSPYECDLEGRRTFGAIQGQAFRSYLATGEIVAEYPWRRRRGGMNGTKVQVVPPFRLSQRTQEHTFLFQGVRTNRDGMPVAYLFEVPDWERGFNFKYEVEKRARDRYGRTRVIHVFDGMPGQVRGITPMVPALLVARRFDQLADATLTASLIHAVFAATITSETPTEEVLEGLLTPQERAKLHSANASPMDAWVQAQAGWYDSVQIDVDMPGRIAHLFPGQKLEMHVPQHPGAEYKEYATHLLRELARAIGITYEEMTGDYAGVTFSSVRMATDVIWRIIQWRRAHIMAPFCQATYENWLEEEIDSGRIELPGGIEQFIANKSGIASAVWAGTPKPQADDLKAAKAHQVYRQMGVMSDAQIAAELGRDVEDVYAEIAEEQKLRSRMKLPPPDSGKPVGERDADVDDREADDGK